MPVPACFGEILERLQERRVQPTIALACAANAAALAAVARAHAGGVAEYLLFGESAAILEAANRANVNMDVSRIREVAGEPAACAAAVKAVASGQAQVLMKGQVHTSTYLRAVLHRETGLHAGRLMSHVFIWEIGEFGRFVLVSDAALNVAPDLKAKVAILENAVRCAQALGVAVPRVALLAAVETVSAKMPATLDAAAITQMSRRGQLAVKAVVDGPLALDLALSPEAVRIKGLESPVAGQADVLIVPDIEAGNMLAKAHAFLPPPKPLAGLVVGARAPVVINSRADSADSKFCSILAAAYTLNSQPPA